MKKISSKNIILIILILLLILESFFLVYFYKKTKEEKKSSKMASLFFEPKEGKFKVGEEFEVKIFVDTGDYQTDATDVRLNFNPQILQVTKITEGKIYDDYPAKRVDLENGVIIINGITSLIKTFKGKDIFAVVTFKGIKPGIANLIFEFEPSSTTDSNVVASGIAKDVLGEVEGASIEIRK